MRRRDQRWTNDLVGRKNKPSSNRCYDAEHVLEWQVLRAFIEQDIEKDDSRCSFLYKHFLTNDMPLKNHKVQVAKNNGKLKADGHSDYEEKEYEFAKWQNKAMPKPRAIDWIGT
jgi:hypothetical protein